MNMPNNYANTSTGDFTPIELGGHHLVIRQVEETTSKTGRPMLKVLFDMAPNDKQAGYMLKEYDDDIRPDKKWPHNGTQYILTEDENGNCSRSFKSFITSFEKSNKCEAIWGEKFASQFAKKRIGGVFGQVENDYNGKTSMRHELRWFCEDSKVDTAAVPAPKYLKGHNEVLGATSKPASDGLPDVDVSGGSEDCPFGK